MIEIKAVPGKLIMLGKQGENLAREVIFDVSGVRAEFGDGAFRLSAKRPGESDAYPATVTETGDTVVWALTGADTQNAGRGQCELAYYAGEIRLKTWTYDTAIAKSLTGSPKTDPYDEFLDEVNRLAAEAAISQREAKTSENAAKNSEENAKASEDAAKTSEDNAAEYARAALAAETKSKQNAENAASAAVGAGQYAQNAATSATNAANSATSAATHEKAAKDAAAAAAKSAEGLADAVKRAEDAAASAQDNAGKTAADREAVAEMKTAAETAKDNAEKSATAAAGSATAAGESATAAAVIKAQIDEIKAGIDATKGEIDQAKIDTLAAKTAAETAAATATEKAAEIADSAAQIATNTENIGKNATGIKTNTTDINLLRRENVELRAKTDALWKLSEGKSYDFVEDATEAYTKNVPTGCRFAQVEKIGGKTVAWNQCAKVTSRSVANNGITWTVDNGVITLSGTLERDYFNWDPTGSEMTVIDHVYLFGKHIIANPANISFYYGQLNRNSFKGLNTSTDTAAIAKMTKEQAASGNGHGLGGAPVDADLTGIKLQVFDIDLTRLFGSGNEPTTTDDPRIAEIIAYVQKHPAYNAGELVSAGVEDVEVQGANLLDPKKTTLTEGAPYGLTITMTGENTFRISGVPSVTSAGDRGLAVASNSQEKLRGRGLKITAFLIKGTVTNAWGLRTADEPFLAISVPLAPEVAIDTELRFMASTAAPSAYSPYSLDIYPIPDAVKALPGYGWSAGNLCNEIVRRADGWDYVQRVGLPATTDGYTALDAPTTTDITDLMTGALPLMTTEPGGTITMHHALADDGLTIDVPSIVKYIRDLKEVASSGTE